jgi:hypothetical protein
MQVGKLADSPSPRNALAIPNVKAVLAAAWAISRQTPYRNGDGKSLARSKPIHQIACAEQANGISGLECAGHVAILETGPANLDFKRLGQHAQDLPLKQVDRSGKE